MSQETRKNAERAKRNLDDAHEYLKSAKEYASKVPDKQLQEKIEKTIQTTKEAVQHVDEKLKDK